MRARRPVLFDAVQRGRVRNRRTRACERANGLVPKSVVVSDAAHVAVIPARLRAIRAGWPKPPSKPALVLGLYQPSAVACSTVISLPTGLARTGGVDRRCVVGEAMPAGGYRSDGTASRRSSSFNDQRCSTRHQTAPRILCWTCPPRRLYHVCCLELYNHIVATAPAPAERTLRRTSAANGRAGPDHTAGAVSNTAPALPPRPAHANSAAGGVRRLSRRQPTRGLHPSARRRRSMCRSPRGTAAATRLATRPTRLLRPTLRRGRAVEARREAQPSTEEPERDSDASGLIADTSRPSCNSATCLDLADRSINGLFE